MQQGMNTVKDHNPKANCKDDKADIAKLISQLWSL